MHVSKSDRIIELLLDPDGVIRRSWDNVIASTIQCSPVMTIKGDWIIDREEAAELAVYLQRWAKTGKLEES